jgi:energy-coupling factor transporter ATP-binding protein EcfA2
MSKGGKQMAIERVEIKDFLVFKGEFSADFCQGVNVIIGENGTGKTTLLKCMYGATDTVRHTASRYFDFPGFAKSRGDVRIAAICGMTRDEFDESKSTANYPPIAVLVSRPAEWSKTDSDFYSKIDKIASRSEEGRKLNEEYMSDPLAFNMNKKSVMIPAAEMLSHSRGLLAMFNERKMPFDQTEIDILAKAQFPETREIKPNAARTLEKIKPIIGGEVVYENDTFYTQKESGEKVSFSLEASGYRKFGLLWKLLRNGLLEKGVILLWDEPENSLNPELVPVLVDILLELARNGVQIFIATHSEILAEYFAVLRKKSNGDEVKFFSLYKDGDHIKHDAGDRFDLLAPNNLTAEPVKVYGLELERGFGGNG